MIDYNAYRAEKGISRGDMIQAIRQRYPKYSKVAQSFVDNPASTGVCLLPEAEYHLVDIYGPPVKKKPNRRKGHRYTVRLGDELNARVLELAARLKTKTMQELIEAALAYYIEQSMGEDG